MGITYRPGEKEDSSQIAEMINTASDGVAAYLFQDVVPGMSPVQVMAHGLENDSYPHSYKNAIVAIEKSRIVGMALSYPSSYHRITDEMRNFLPADRLAHMTDFYSSRIENSWYLDALCVRGGHRRCGIGEKLITLTKEKALENGFDVLSLIVFADNESAIPLYKKTGFHIAQRVELGGNEVIKHWDGCLLMRCEIQT